nr:MAG TPA: hypothetical protein [Podoviridae sp. ctAVH8]
MASLNLLLINIFVSPFIPCVNICLTCQFYPR